MDWPPQSPDLNPIENIWGFMKIKLLDFNPKNRQELKNILLKIWEELPSEFLGKLIKGMHNRCEEVIKARGGHINY